MLLLLSRLANKIYWWLHHRLIKPYNIVRIKSLSPDYHDKDEIMLHACFQLLVNYVELEKPFEWFGWTESENQVLEEDDCDGDYQFRINEVRYLYNWWKTERAKEWAEYEQNWNYAKLEALEEKDQTNLMRLIAIREFLWT